MNGKMTMEDMLSCISTDAKTMKEMLDDMVDHTEPYRLHGLQVIVDHQIEKCSKLSQMIMEHNTP